MDTLIQRLNVFFNLILQYSLLYYNHHCSIIMTNVPHSLKLIGTHNPIVRVLCLNFGIYSFPTPLHYYQNQKQIERKLNYGL